MNPILKNGDRAIIDRSNKGTLINKIVCFQKDRSFIVHRVIEEKDGYVLTKGDANQNSDGWIRREQIIGKVILVIPFWVIISLKVCGNIIIVIIIILVFKLIKKKLDHSEQKKVPRGVYFNPVVLHHSLYSELRLFHAQYYLSFR